MKIQLTVLAILCFGLFIQNSAAVFSDDSSDSSDESNDLLALDCSDDSDESDAGRSDEDDEDLDEMVVFENFDKMFGNTIDKLETFGEKAVDEFLEGLDSVLTAMVSNGIEDTADHKEGQEEALGANQTPNKTPTDEKDGDKPEANATSETMGNGGNVVEGADVNANVAQSQTNADNKGEGEKGEGEGDQGEADKDDKDKEMNESSTQKPLTADIDKMETNLEETDIGANSNTLQNNGEA